MIINVFRQLQASFNKKSMTAYKPVKRQGCCIEARVQLSAFTTAAALHHIINSLHELTPFSLDEES
jgi:hypothetical protein